MSALMLSVDPGSSAEEEKAFSRVLLGLDALKGKYKGRDSDGEYSPLSPAHDLSCP